MTDFKPRVTHIAIRREDGTVSIMVYLLMARGSVLPAGATWFNEKAGIWTRGATPELIEEEIRKGTADKAHGAVLGWRFLNIGEELPHDRTYRNAWVDTGKRIEHDMPKAREIHRHHIRKRRAVAMRELDGKWMRAQGQGKKAEANAVEAERQKWRDLPADPRIEAAQTAEELKQLLEGL